MKKQLAVFLVLFWVLALACTLPVNQNSSPPDTPAEQGTSPGDANTAGEQGDSVSPTQSADTALSPPPTSPPAGSQAIPVGIREGLASLNSYVMNVQLDTAGPEPEVQSSMQMEYYRDSNQHASLVHMKSTESTVEEPEPYTTESYNYDVGLDTCNGSGTDWEYQAQTPVENELMEVFSQLIDFNPIFNDPELVGSETLNGVASDHYVFKLSGLGVDSGADVTMNQGEYWIAQDGGYLVKYVLVAEEQNEPGKPIRFSVAIELTSINQPVEITLPAECLALK